MNIGIAVEAAHCLTNDAELFAAADDMAEFGICHAAELLARDRAAATKAEVGQIASSIVRRATFVRQRTQGAL